EALLTENDAKLVEDDRELLPAALVRAIGAEGEVQGLDRHGKLLKAHEGNTSGEQVFEGMIEAFDDGGVVGVVAHVEEHVDPRGSTPVTVAPRAPGPAPAGPGDPSIPAA